ncbi:MAG TPA: hypothetical protein PL037_08095, partial [Elusimicrobiales bacterium]|nr:hypothetical protein [Elusimicrobiales bacterium]
PREQLVADYVYYWKVEGLDASGNTISQSAVNSFSLRALAASQSRNIIVTDVSMTSSLPPAGQPASFKVVVYNAGSNAESNIGVKFSLGGLNAQDSPKQAQILNSGEQKDLTFSAFMPSDQESSLAVACVDVFDDNLTDNCKTALISRTAGSTSSPGEGSGSFTYDELWNTLMQRLGPDALKALEGYTFDTIECPGCTSSELADILSGLISGDATLAAASISETAAAASSALTSASTSAEGELESAAAAESPEMDLEILKQSVQGQEEWSGYTAAFPGKDASTLVITDKKAWKKLWQSLSESEVPFVDFGSRMVLGIVSAPRDRAETIRILSRRKTEEGLVVDYYYIQAPRGKQVPSGAYILKVVPKEIEKVGFRRLDADGGGK